MHRFSRLGHAREEQDETIQSRTPNVGSFAFCVGDRLCSTRTDAKGMTPITQDQAPDTGIRYGYFGY